MHLRMFTLDAGGDDDIADVSADMGWSNATASDTEAKAAVDRQTDIFSHNSWPCQLHSHTQHSP